MAIYLSFHRKIFLKSLCQCFLIFFLLLSGQSWAQQWTEPQRGSDTRKALMDAIRPHIEWHLGKPIQFVVEDLRVSGNVGFGTLLPQRPGGAKIDLMKTPAVESGYIDLDFVDGTRVDVLYKKLRKTWVAVHFAIGATDVWYGNPIFCDEYKSVIPDWCNF